MIVDYRYIDSRYELNLLEIAVQFVSVNDESILEITSLHHSCQHSYIAIPVKNGEINYVFRDKVDKKFSLECS